MVEGTNKGQSSYADLADLVEDLFNKHEAPVIEGSGRGRFSSTIELTGGDDGADLLTIKKKWSSFNNNPELHVYIGDEASPIFSSTDESNNNVKVAEVISLLKKASG